MQDTLLRVFVVALGLLTHPMNDPSVEEEWDEVDMQNYEKKLPREEENLNQEIAPAIEEITCFDCKGPWEDIRNIIEDQHESDQFATERDKMSVMPNKTVKQNSEEDGADDKLPEVEHFLANSDSTQKSKSKPEDTLDPEQKANLQLDIKSKQRGNIQNDGSFRNSNRPQGQQETPEKEEASSSPSQVHTKTLENETEKVIPDWKEDYLCYVWNTFSIISMIIFFRKYIRKNSPNKQGKAGAFPVSCTTSEVSLPDSDTLQSFHSKCVQGSSKKWRDSEFLEGFANDLLEAMKNVCNRNGGMMVEDFWMSASIINVPFTPPEPYSFQCLLWNNQVSDLLPDMQVCGQVKVVENKLQDVCHCQSSDAEDMVCLLHCDSEKAQTTHAVFDSLCLKNTPYLSKSRVTRWFRGTIKQAWALISHKYEFELNICYIDAPGALVIRFRSGKKINFRMNPVVKFNTDAHFYITPCSPRNLDIFWAISLAVYEESLLQHLSRRLPENSCHVQTLEIACFLHRRQTALSGCSALKDFHFKSALMHLLLTKDPAQWKPHYVTQRLQDLMDFMERSLEKKLLHHVLIGNRTTQGIIELPAAFTVAKPVNLFHPLVVHSCVYSNAMMHFHEMLRNAHMMILDYTDQCFDNESCSA